MGTAGEIRMWQGRGTSRTGAAMRLMRQCQAERQTYSS